MEGKEQDTKQIAECTIVEPKSFKKEMVDTGVDLIPLIGACNRFYNGEFWKGGINVAGDMLTLVGVGYAFKCGRAAKAAQGLKAAAKGAKAV